MLLHQDHFLGHGGFFAQLCVMMLYITNASYMMSLWGCSLNGNADVFPKTSQITSGVLPLSFFANSMHFELGITEMKVTMVDYAPIDAMLMKREHRYDSFCEIF